MVIDVIDAKERLFFLFACILGIFVIILFGIYQFNKNSIRYIYPKKSIIYTSSKSDNKNIPFINLRGTSIEQVNQNISDFVGKYINDSDIFIDYQYQKNGTILSLLITVIQYQTIGVPEVLFQSYHIDLTNNQFITNQDLLEYVHQNSNTLQERMNRFFLDYYHDSEISGFCDEVCFFDDLNNYYDFNRDVTLFLQDGKLMAYLSIHEKMEFMEYQFFKERNYSTKVGDFHD